MPFGLNYVELKTTAYTKYSAPQLIIMFDYHCLFPCVLFRSCVSANGHCQSAELCRQLLGVSSGC